ncbi:MAG: NAD(+)/NADH kinase [Acidilobus sp.]|nr:NAD(+)/NADH kinase [Acidilobus sp.]MCG2895827.1 NAD(+)/NADH kinase [Acidilobus sp.]
MGSGVGLVVRPSSDVAERIALEVIQRVKEAGWEPLIEVESAEAYPGRLGGLRTFSLDRDPPDRVIVIGGDGTLLRAAIKAGDNDVVFMAVRAGKRGFLLDVDETELGKRIPEFLRGEFEIVEHQRIRAEIEGAVTPCALNDIVVFTAEGQMVRLDVMTRGERVMGLDGDGLVISTTTGSTAYSLNAGGPIIDPRLDVIVLTPLNPVQLYLRPVVMSRSERLTIRLREDSGAAYLVIDGQVKHPLRPGALVSVGPCPRPLRVARFNWWANYYERLFARLLSYW